MPATEPGGPTCVPAPACTPAPPVWLWLLSRALPLNFVYAYNSTLESFSASSPDPDLSGMYRVYIHPSPQYSL